MNSTIGGFIAGFFLAMLIVWLGAFIYISPHIDTINTAVNVNTEIYDITHSNWFSSATGFMSQLKGLSIIPGIGNIASAASGIADFLIKVKTYSEKLKVLLGFLQFIAQYALIAAIISIIGFFIGLIIIGQSRQTTTTQNMTKFNDIYCSQCGEKNSTDSKFCSKCGEKI